MDETPIRPKSQSGFLALLFSIMFFVFCIGFVVMGYRHQEGLETFGVVVFFMLSTPVLFLLFIAGFVFIARCYITNQAMQGTISIIVFCAAFASIIFGVTDCGARNLAKYAHPHPSVPQHVITKEPESDLLPEKNSLRVMKGMTWTLIKTFDRQKDLVLVGCNNGNPGGCDAYKGDAMCSQSLPLLCLHRTQEQRPDILPHDNTQTTWSAPQDFYREWAGAKIKTSHSTSGEMLTSREAADQICEKEFGDGWRMAEFHDGAGWSFWARAASAIPANQHFWVAIDDQQANCWNRTAP